MRYVSLRPGFTVIETIITIGIFAMLMAATLPFLGNVRERHTLDAEVIGLTQAIRRAQQRSLSSLHESTWSVHIFGTGYILFAGTNFAARDIDFDERRLFDDVYTLSGSGEVQFSALDGKPVSSARIQLQNPLTGTGEVQVSPTGVISSSYTLLGTE